MNFLRWSLSVGFLILSSSIYPGNPDGQVLDGKAGQGMAVFHSHSLFGHNAPILPDFLEHYLELQNALTADDYVQAKKTASDMKRTLENSSLNEKQQVHIKATVEQLILADHIEGQRIAFAVLSEQLYQILPGIDFGREALFWHNCPMALGGRGGNWISREEQVKNPFMGQAMLTCGTALEKLMR